MVSTRGRYRTSIRLFAPTFIVGIGLIYHQARTLSVLRDMSMSVHHAPDQFHTYANVNPQQDKQVSNIRASLPLNIVDPGHIMTRNYNDKILVDKHIPTMQTRENCQIVYVLGVEGG